jgi:branched-chain amino acid transport system ATP-binding protein
VAEALLRVEGLHKQFGGVVATDRLDLSVPSGEMHALIGPNGAGKTTLIHQLSGALRPDGGRILLDGRDITRISLHQRVQLGVARSYQVTSIFLGVSVLHNLALAVLARRGSSLRFWRPLAREGSLFDEARTLVGQVGLAGREHVVAGTLAHGEQRQLEVGLALATRARLLLLDEPLAGLGPEESQRVIALIDGLKGALAVLLVEHDMDAVFRLADRISVLDSGRIIATGTPQAIRNDAKVKRAYLGDEAVLKEMPA